LDSRFQAYLDRFEGGSAVLLVDGAEILIPAALLPPEAAEGEHLQVSMTVDKDARRKTTEEISRLQERLQSGDEEA